MEFQNLANILILGSASPGKSVRGVSITGNFLSSGGSTVTGVDAQRGTLEVKLRVPEPPQYLRQDMTVSVDIEVARRDRALVVSADCVRDAENAQPWVLKVNDGNSIESLP